MIKIFNIDTPLKIMCKIYGHPFIFDDYSIEFKQGFNILFLTIIAILFIATPISMYFHTNVWCQ